VYNTTLCTLMLEVYYRYLPTYALVLDDGDDVFARGEDGVEVEVSFPDV
jgi:hypothetical protein